MQQLFLLGMAATAGLEPATFEVGTRCSIQLSYVASQLTFYLIACCLLNLKDLVSAK